MDRAQAKQRAIRQRVAGLGAKSIAGRTAMARPTRLNAHRTLHKTVQIDGLDIFYREAGPMDAPTILLLHGFPTSSHMFRNLIPALADEFHLVAPDYPGYRQVEAISPDNWIIDQALMDRPGNKKIQVAMFYDYRTNVPLYPIRQEKIEALKASIKSTGFWNNVVARVVGGYAEITYGHHRLAALREEYDDDHPITLIIRDLDDETMLKMMAAENMDEWRHDASVEMETIKAVIEAYADGRIKLPKPPKQTKAQVIRHAPSCIAGGSSPASGDHP